MSPAVELLLCILQPADLHAKCVHTHQQGVLCSRHGEDGLQQELTATVANLPLNLPEQLEAFHCLGKESAVDRTAVTRRDLLELCGSAETRRVQVIHPVLACCDCSLTCSCTAITDCGCFLMWSLVVIASVLGDMPRIVPGMKVVMFSHTALCQAVGAAYLKSAARLAAPQQRRQQICAMQYVACISAVQSPPIWHMLTRVLSSQTTQPAGQDNCAASSWQQVTHAAIMLTLHQCTGNLSCVTATLCDLLQHNSGGKVNLSSSQQSRPSTAQCRWDCQEAGGPRSC